MPPQQGRTDAQTTQPFLKRLENMKAVACRTASCYSAVCSNAGILEGRYLPFRRKHPPRRFDEFSQQA